MITTEFDDVTAIAWPAQPEIIAAAGPDGQIHVFDPLTGDRKTTCIGHSETRSASPADLPSQTRLD